jgi:hypothetical protein
MARGLQLKPKEEHRVFALFYRVLECSRKRVD